MAGWKPEEMNHTYTSMYRNRRKEHFLDISVLKSFVPYWIGSEGTQNSRTGFQLLISVDGLPARLLNGQTVRVGRPVAADSFPVHWLGS